MSPVTEPDLDAEYRQIREECGLVERADRAWLEVTGPDAAGFLQSQVTNETEELAAGSGVYAALLDRKGHLQAEMRILRLDGERFLIDTEATTGPALLKHFSMYKIGRKVEVGETDRALFSLIGPAAVEVTGLTPGSENDFTETVIAGAGCLVVVTALGLDVICDPGSSDAVRAQLEADRAVPVSAEAAEILRVERGRPRFGFDMTEANMPAEAGIVDRAVSFTKGCYIGQEPVARLHYKGRPNRHLRGLRPGGPVAHGDPVRLGDRQLGEVGTAVLSPASGRIALSILRKEAEPGSVVTVETEAGEVEAEVVELPFIEGSGI
ncbi:MAG TPA: glycine cleavage T C-terminal barrel domain-containing protein [Solirubrobacterales bacterium]|nr:folate-binding protein [Solirubrobacterales bacterium]HMU26151.1 glycine cleavage T C-terminal barrel domain-containing protein [Solirubrobacterales bacterium]HMX71868.1 glycine cleavage T C-terminal barrel domain-containing protein [Solirubrobacterales bacterium]HMY25933.1 glycine cleavage T C-terminal barrel domain-containing protein [Solirubrobacterales bacterium]HNA25002.1 glycine cleavage T C-terminal barrel domain-containing protein [Solirubrobacterales bacterium]